MFIYVPFRMQHVFCFVFVFVFFCLYHTSCGISVSSSETEPMPPVLEAQSLNYGATREVPSVSFKKCVLTLWNYGMKMLSHVWF